MQQNDDNNMGLVNKTNSSREDRIKKTEDWRNEHGQPSFEYLQSLAADGSLASLEKLRSIAEDLDLSFGSEASAEELIAKILAAT